MSDNGQPPWPRRQNVAVQRLNRFSGAADLQQREQIDRKARDMQRCARR
jgi:hypothetical protein